MPAFSRTINLILRTDTGPLSGVLASVSGASPAPPVQWVAKDIFTLNVLFATPNGSGSFVGQQIPGGDQLLIMGKAVTLTGAALFTSTVFTEQFDGTNYYYQCQLSLDNLTLLAAITASGNTQLQVICTVQEQDLANDSRISYIFPVVIWAPGIIGTEGVPPAGDPSYPSPAAIALAAVDQAEIDVAAAVASANLFPATAFSTIFTKIVASAGGGAYVANYVLPDGSMLPGALAIVNVELPASANPTLNLYDNTTAGTLLQTVTNPAPAAAAYWFGLFKFGAGHWHKLFGSFQ